MVKLTEELIRRKAEHHDGPLTTLEELTLHQLELERIEPVLGSVCRRLRILYLQNNIIAKMENLHHMKDMRYLNMGLNNVTRVEGLGSCEFLNKLDLIVNFVDVDELEAAVEHMGPLLHLKELFLMGNPCTEWPGFRAFVVASLPQLGSLDGTEVSRAERITAQQQLRRLRGELRVLAAAKREEKGLPRQEDFYDGPDEDGNEPWSPEARLRMYREMSEQKEEQERVKKAREPPERNYAREQAAAVEGVRAREAEAGEGIRQCNEGRWDFVLEDEDGRGNCVLRLGLSRFLDTSLVDVDTHPAYLSVVVKSRVFRIRWPEEVDSSAATCQRSQASGELVVTAPKSVRPPKEALERWRRDRAEEGGAGAASGAGGAGGGARVRLGPGERADSVTAMRVAVAGGGSSAARRSAAARAAAAAAADRPAPPPKLAEQIKLAAVSIAGIATAGGGGPGAGGGGGGAGVGADAVGDGLGGSSLFRAASSTRTPAPVDAGAAARVRARAKAAAAADDDDDEEGDGEKEEEEAVVDEDGDEVPDLA